jgi:PAS domain S-box-containing protein
MRTVGRLLKSRESLSSLTVAILESITDGVFTVDSQWRVTYFNKAAEEITGTSREEAIGRRCSEVFKSSMCENHCALGQTLSSGKPIVCRSGFIINAHGERVPVSVSTAVLRDEEGNVIGGAETFRDMTELEALRKEIKGKYTIGDLVSHSAAMRPIFELVPPISASRSTALIQGETGTGKELLARAIHGMDPDPQKPFIAVNCAALPDSLLESELFGYRKGAFTGALADKPGRFALAGNGTLFLDEVGEISPSLQVKLLRVLQERTYEPLGGTKSEVSNARIICATNRSLASLVESGEFRQDLYYRINVITLKLPPLRDRKDDIPLLSMTFIHKFNNIQQRNILGITAEAYSYLTAYDWPGNVRELQNIIERAFIVCSGKYIGVNHLPLQLRGMASEPARGTMRNIKDAAEVQSIITALTECGYNKAKAARVLGIHKTTLFRKMKKLQIPFTESG